MIKIDCFDISILTDDQYARLYQQATQYRKEQANRYLRQEDKIRCVCADALLRNALQRDDYAVGFGAQGKPYLTDVDGFYYNLSHSGRWVVIAYGPSELGVDVQQFRTQGTEGIARRFFTVEEQAHLEHQPDDFFRIWTEKESYLKYLGVGLTKALNSFSVLEDLRVNFFTEQLEDACLTLCTKEKEYSLRILESI